MIDAGYPESAFDRSGRSHQNAPRWDAFGSPLVRDS